MTYNFIKELTRKYGGIESFEHCGRQCNLLMLSANSYLNLYFNAIGWNYYEKLQSTIGCVLPDELVDFYRQYNGVLLFSQSFAILGLRINDNDSCKPVEFVMRNAKYSGELSKSGLGNYVIFGYCCAQQFLFDKNNPNGEIITFDTNKLKVCHRFSNLSELLEYYVPRLSAEYSKDGYIIDKKNELFANMIKKDF